MLASAVGRRDMTGDEWRVEPKLDGWRAMIRVDRRVVVRNRTGRDLTALLPELVGLADVA